MSRSNVTVTNISQSVPHTMATETGRHRYSTKKLRHCHPAYLYYY